MMKQYPPSFDGKTLTIANIVEIGEKIHQILDGETFTIVELNRLAEPQIFTREYLSTRHSWDDNVLDVNIFADGTGARLTISTHQQNWFFEAGKTTIDYDRGRRITFTTSNFNIQTIFKLDEGEEPLACLGENGHFYCALHFPERDGVLDKLSGETIHDLATFGRIHCSVCHKLLWPAQK